MATVGGLSDTSGFTALPANTLLTGNLERLHRKSARRLTIDQKSIFFSPFSIFVSLLVQIGSLQLFLVSWDVSPLVDIHIKHE